MLTKGADRILTNFRSVRKNLMLSRTMFYACARDGQPASWAGFYSVPYRPTLRIMEKESQ